MTAARELLGVLYSNRSFTHEQLEDAQGALADAQVVRRKKRDCHIEGLPLLGPQAGRVGRGGSAGLGSRSLH